MVLLNPLQEQRSVETKLKHFLKTRHVVIKERESAYPALDAFGRVLVSGLRAKVINLYHIAVIFLQEPNDIPSAITVERLCALCRETARDDSISDVGHIQIKVIYLETGLVRRNLFSNPI